MTLTLGYAGMPDTPQRVLSVDGMAEAGPNLSHWPGNRTPARWKADLSTGICLAFAAAPAAERAEFLSGVTVALNDHYDTDGFLSLLAVLRSDVALPRRELLLEAAATGDYQALHTTRGFAVDRIVVHLAAAHSPVHVQFAALQGPAKDHARYRWLLDHAEAVLDGFADFGSLYLEELAGIERELTAPDVQCDILAQAGLAVIESPGPLHRVTLNTLAGNAYRVLHIQTDGPRYRYHDRTESWFEVVSFTPPPRRDLEPLRQQLAAADDPAATWNLDPRDQPVPELYHGPAATQVYGQITRQLTPSRLLPDRVVELFAGFLGETS